MNIYECDAIIKRVDELAQLHDGEIPEEMIERLVEANTGIEKIGDLCGFMKYLEHGMESCKAEESRIKAMRDKAAKRLASIKKYLTPYVAEHGKQTAGTFTLSVRKSEQVELNEWFSDDNYIVVKTTKAPDKKKIKMDLKQGKEIAGATIVTRQNLQFK